MEHTSNQKGDLTELYVLTHFMEMGIIVSTPYGQNSRYDMIIDYNNHLYRIQVKTSHSDNNGETFMFYSASSHITARGCHKVTYSKDEIDFFATIWDNQLYLIPVEECGSTVTLRIAPPKNNATKNIRFAKDYTFKEIMKEK